MSGLNNPLTDREVIQLVKLLDKFSKLKDKDSHNIHSVEISQIIDIVRQWVKWYGVDELGMDLSPLNRRR